MYLIFYMLCPYSLLTIIENMIQPINYNYMCQSHIPCQFRLLLIFHTVDSKENPYKAVKTRSPVQTKVAPDI